MDVQVVEIISTNFAERWMFRMHDNDEFILLEKVEDLIDEQSSGVNRERR